MTPAELDAYAEVMTRHGITALSVGDVTISMPTRIAVAAPQEEKTQKKRANGVDAALSLDT